MFSTKLTQALLVFHSFQKYAALEHNLSSALSSLQKKYCINRLVAQERNF